MNVVGNVDKFCRMAPPVGAEERAGVTFPAPHGIESIVLGDGEVAEFGRGGTCRIRFGYAPIADLAVPRVAGRLVVAAGRVFVEAREADGRAALAVSAEDRPPVMIGSGDAFCPAGASFRVTVHGDTRTWPIDVAIRATNAATPVAQLDDPTRTLELNLSDSQRRIIDAYCEPLRRGRLEPATHREVAEQLGCHHNTAREVLYSVWSTLFAADVPMPDVADKRVAVTEAIRLHRLLQ